MPAATAAMPSSASPRPAPSSASRSGTTSAPGSSSPATQPSPTSRNSSLSVAQQPNPPGLLLLLRNILIGMSGRPHGAIIVGKPVKALGSIMLAATDGKTDL